jgi:arylsulfatase A-like enzyme
MITNGVVTASGTYAFAYAVPGSALPGNTYVRFRISSVSGLGPDGSAPDGEVEDYGAVIETSSEPPPVVLVGDLPHVAIGNATVSGTSNTVLVSNLGSNGQDGVSIGLLELSRTARLQFAPVSLDAPGTSLSFALSGMVNDLPGTSLGRLFLRNESGVVELGFQDGPDWGQWLRMEVYQDGTLLGSASVAPGGVLATLSGLVRLTSLTVGEANPSASEWTLMEITFADAVGFSVPAASGNRLRLVGVSPAGALQNLMQLDVTGSGLDSLLIEQEEAPRFAPRLRIEDLGQRHRLRWDTRSAVLQRAPTVDGPWTRVVEGQNSFEEPNDAEATFYRLDVSPTVLDTSFCSLTPLAGYVCQRNILLIIADDVGMDHVPCYINYYATNSSSRDDIYSTSHPVLNPATIMPAVDKLAASGVTFLNAWSSPVCSPTRACLYTGTHSQVHGVFGVVMPGSDGLPSGSTTVATVLGASGYANGLFGKWHLGETTGYNPLDFDWDTFKGSLGGALPSYFDWEKYDGKTSLGNVTDYATTNNVEDALDWISSQAGPWMATVAFNAAHSSQGTGGWYYEDPPAGCAYQSRFASTDKAKYRAMLECMDRSISNLLSRMDSNVLAQTTIIFLGDNGTEQDITDHFSTNNFPSYGARNHSKASLYEGGINVPLIVADGYTFLHGQESSWRKGRGRVVSPGRFETNIVETLDLFATAAEIGRGDASSGSDSVSIVPYLTSASAFPQRDTISTGTRVNGWTWGDTGWDVAVRGNCYKIIIRDYLSSSGETYELYDLSTDRWETTDLNDGSLTVSEAYSLLSGCP